MGADGDVILKVSLKAGDIDTAAEEIRDALKGILDKKSSDGIDDLNDSIEILVDEIDDLIKKITELSDSMTDILDINKKLVESQEDLMEWMNMLLDSQSDMVDSMDLLTESAMELMDQMTGLTESNTGLAEANDRLTESHEELEEWINLLIDSDRELGESNSGLNETLYLLIESLDNLGMVIIQLMSQLGELESSTGALISTNDALRQSTDGLRQTDEELSGTVSELTGRMTEVGRSAVLNRGAIDVWGKFEALLGRISNLLRRGFGTVTNTISRVTATVRRLINGFNGMFQNVKRGFMQTNATIMDSVKRLMRFQVIFSLIRGLFNKIRVLASEGLNNLAHYSSEFNKTMSIFTTDIQWMKNALAAAISPLVNIIAPIFDQIATHVAEALNMISKFFATITGQKVWYKAVRQQKDYAQATQEATQAMQKQVAAYDNLLVIGEDATGGGGGNTPDYGGMFETVPVDSEFSEWLDMWENADFTELGALFGRKINEALESIPWDDIQKTIGKIGKSLATFLNGAIETIDWELVGYTLAQGFNTIVTFWDEFVANLHFDSIGTAIGETINGLVDNIDWDKLFNLATNLGTGFAQLLNALGTTTQWETVGNTIANGLNVIVTAFDSFVAELNFTVIGAAIGQTINGLITGINWDRLNSLATNLGTGIANLFNSLGTTLQWKSIGAALASAVNTIQTTLQNFVDTFDFEAFGTNMSTMVNGFFDEWSDEDFSEVVSGWVNGVIDTISSFFKGFHAEENGGKIGRAISMTLRKIKIDEAGHMVTVVATKFFGFFNGVFEEIDWETLGLNLGSLLTDKIDWDDIINTLQESIGIILESAAGFLEGLVIGLFASDEVKEEYRAYQEFVSNLEEEGSKAQSLIDEIDTEFENIETNTELLRKYADRFVELYQKEDKTNEELTEYNSIQEYLSQHLPGFNSLIDEATGEFNGQTSAVYDLITSLDELSRRQAAESALSKLYEQIFTEATNIQQYRNDIISKFSELSEMVGEEQSGRWGQKYTYDENDLRVLRDYVDGLISLEDVTLHFMNVGKPMNETANEIINLADGMHKCQDNATNLGSEMESMYQVIADYGGAIGDTHRAFENVSDDVKRFADDLWDCNVNVNNLSEEGLTNLYNAFINSGQSIDTFAESIMGQVGAIESSEDAFHNQIDAITDLSGAYDGMSEAMEDASLSQSIAEGGFKNLEDALDTLIDSMGGFVEMTGDNVLQSFDDIRKKAQEVADTNKDGLGFVDAKTTIQDFLAGLADAGYQLSDFTDTELAVLYYKFKESGENSIIGFTEGLQSEYKVNDLKTALGLLTGDVLSTFNNGMEIQSPSKKMKQSGEYVVEGLIEGINAQLTKLEIAMEKLPKKIKFKMNNASNIISEEGKEMMDGFIDAVKNGMITVEVYFGTVGQKIRTALVERGSGSVNAILKVSGNQMMQGFAESLNTGFTMVQNVVAGFPNRIVNALGDLSYIGRNAATQIANGFRNVHLPVPVYNAGTKYREVAGTRVPLPDVSISWLAKGAVLPPNQPFLAMLGDQKSGTNVEAPLDTIKQAVSEVIGNGGGREPIIIQLDGKPVAQVVWSEEDKKYKQYGSYAPSF